MRLNKLTFPRYIIRIKAEKESISVLRRDVFAYQPLPTGLDPD